MFAAAGICSCVLVHLKPDPNTEPSTCTAPVWIFCVCAHAWLNEACVLGGGQELLLPDGTDYASFRRALLREGATDGGSSVPAAARLGADYAAFKQSLLSDGGLPQPSAGAGKPGAMM